MSVTGVTPVAVSFRTVNPEPSHATMPVRKAPQPTTADSVELSQQAAAEARSAEPSMRAETRLKTFDTDGDGVVTKNEFTSGAVELLKRASVHFYHQRVARGAAPKPIPEA